MPERPRPLGRAQERPRRPRSTASTSRATRTASRLPSAGKGSPRTDKTWSIDGLDVTDMSGHRRVRRPTSTSTRSRRSTSPPAAATSPMQTRRHRHQPGRRSAAPTSSTRRRYIIVNDEDVLSRNLPDEHQERPAALEARSRHSDHIRARRTTASTSAAPSSRTSCGSTARYGKQDIKLHPPAPDAGQDAAARVQRQAELAGHGPGRWCRRSTSTARSRSSAARRQRLPVSRGRQLPRGTRTTPTPTAGCRGGLWKLQVNHTFSPNFFIFGQGRLLRHRLRLRPPRGGDRCKSYTIDYVGGHRHRPYTDYLADPAASRASSRRQLLLRRRRRQQRAEVRFSYRDLTTN